MTTSGVIGILQFAIDGITQQQNATANNIANEATPRYRASEVSFEQSLQQALAAGGPTNAQVTTASSTRPAATNGNNVDLGAELVAATQDMLHYQEVSNSLNAQLRLVQGAAGGGYK